MPPKSIFRQPGAKHFQLVHRSQRDPLINDPDASQHVLKPVERENVKKGKSRADLEEILSPESTDIDGRNNVGEATLYGVYYDDTEYDYMQHLRPVGVQEDGVESMLIEAPSPSSKTKSRMQKKAGFDLLDLPEGVLASASELPRTYESQQSIPESIAGFQPDMNPHLRQVLDALEDDAFVDDGLGDDFFGQLVAEGERDSEDDVDFDFEEEYGEKENFEASQNNEGTWEESFAKFKKEQKQSPAAHGSDIDSASEGGDTVGTLPAMSVIGGKRRRRKGTSDASGYSMSSSSMCRNDALQTLDQRFDQIILREYNEEVEDDDDIPSDDDSDDAPELITSRDDFDVMINEFLNDFEILGRKMKPKLEGESGVEKLNTIRRAMGQDERIRIARDGEDELQDDELLIEQEEDKKDRWDCETILTTYTNLDNHPRLIRARDAKPVPKILLDQKTGLPFVTSATKCQPQRARKSAGAPRIPFSNSEDTDESDSDNTDVGRRHAAVGRSRNETKEEKKARKTAVKAERQARRVEKKAVKEQFGVELKDQMKRIGNKETRLKKL